MFFLYLYLQLSVFRVYLPKNWKLKAHSLKTILKRPVIILMTMMVMSFSLGSLINFHFNRIYGNPLATELIFAKKDEKSTDSVKQVSVSLFTYGFIPAEELIPEVRVLIISKDQSRFFNPLNTTAGNAGSGLRAPPLA
jgi:hypothetical protein